MPPTLPKTRTGPPKLSEHAKHLVAPNGIASTGWPSVLKTCNEKLGVTFDPWQDGAGRLILAKREDGTLAATIDGVGISLPRQVGKTYLIGATVFALCINMPGLLVIWSAHHARTHGETFLSMQGFAERAKVAPHVRQVFTGSGDEEIRFHNGSRILFGARERGFGRGIPGVDVLIFDEAQILSDKALSNMLATMNTSRYGLQLYIGTPPKPEDMSESFKRMRREALAGTLTDGAWIEFGADAGADGEDRTQWRKANPSFPKRTPAQSLLRLKRKLAAADWLREGLGIWDEDAAGSRAISAEAWRDTGIDGYPTDGVPSYAVAFSMNGERITLAGAFKTGDEIHLEVIEAAEGDTERNLGKLADWFMADAPNGKPRWTNAAAIVLCGSAGATVLSQSLTQRGVKSRLVRVANTPQYLAACAMLDDSVKSKTVTHRNHESQAGLDSSIAVVDKDKRGGWLSTVPDGDETPVEAISLALWGAKTFKQRSGAAVFR